MIKVKFKDHILYVEEEVLSGNTSGAIAPEHHVDKDGELLVEAAFGDLGDSFGHIYGTKIVRYGNVIGSIDELERI
jgi:hypothetical protein